VRRPSRRLFRWAWRIPQRDAGKIGIRYFGRHIDALARYEELREAIEDWSNRRGGIDIKT